MLAFGFPNIRESVALLLRTPDRKQCRQLVIVPAFRSPHHVEVFDHGVHLDLHPVLGKLLFF